MLPIRRYLGLSVAVFHWRPSDFWAATPYEFYAAIDAQTEITAQSSRKPDQSNYEDWYETMPDHLKE